MFSFNKSFAALVSETVLACVPVIATAQSCGGGWTFIDPGNEAKITTFIGPPTQEAVCVQFVDAETRQAACTQLWRNAEPGGKKELDTHCGGRMLDTKGALYEVFVRNTTGRPI